MRHAYDLQEIGKRHFINTSLYIFGQQSLTHLIQSSTITWILLEHDKLKNITIVSSEH